MPRRKLKGKPTSLPGGKDIQPVMCKTCPKQTNGHAVQLHPDRIAEITALQLQGAAHSCHSVNNQLWCRGFWDYRLEIWARTGVIPEPTDEALEKAYAQWQTEMSQQDSQQDAQQSGGDPTE